MATGHPCATTFFSPKKPKKKREKCATSVATQNVATVALLKNHHNTETQQTIRLKSDKNVYQQNNPLQICQGFFTLGSMCWGNFGPLAAALFLGLILGFFQLRLVFKLLRSLPKVENFLIPIYNTSLLVKKKPSLEYILLVFLVRQKTKQE